MGVTVDSRTIIETGGDYRVAYPNEDVLMSEILSMIATPSQQPYKRPDTR